MSFEGTSDLARAALARCEGLGFDRLAISALRSRLLGVRIANGAVCRENIDRFSEGFDVRGSYASREGGFEAAAGSTQDLEARVRALRETLERQPPDAEHVPPETPSGSYAYDLAVEPFDEAYAPDNLYGTIALLSRRARARGLRLTGYIEAQETTALRLVRGAGANMELATRDHGLTVSLTVDDPATGAVSAGNRGVARATQARVATALEEAYSEAERQCLAARQPTTPLPGDYTVVLHPQAVVDIVNTALAYGLFDRRKIDEGRTYLAGRVGEQRFPSGLGLAQTTSLALGGGLSPYLDMPFNHRLVACADVPLIRDGRIEGLHTSPFWARQQGLAETFDANAAPPATSLEARACPGIELEDDLAALIRSTERGFYVANTWYLRMVAEMEGVITGMTRDGVFAIDNGHLVGPVLNMRWHDNPFRMLGAVTGATRERMLLGRSRMAGQGRTRLSAAPALRIENFHVSSVTKF